MSGSWAAVTLTAGRAVARMPAYVDLANADIICAQIVSAIPSEASGATVDLSATEYIDSAGIEMLLRLAERLAWRRQTLQLVVRRDSQLARLLQITGVDDTLALTIHDA